MAKKKKSNQEKKPKQDKKKPENPKKATKKLRDATAEETKVKRIGRKKKFKLDNDNIDNVNTTVLSEKMLLRYLYNICEAIVSERKEKWMYDFEKKVIMSYWGSSRNELYETKVDLRNAEAKLEEAIDENELKSNLWKRKVMHVMYDQKEYLADFFKEAFRQRKKVEDGFDERSRELESDIRSLKMKESDVIIIGDQRVRALKLQYSKEDSELRRRYYKGWAQLDHIYNKRYDILINQYKHDQRAEILELEKRKKEEINELMKDHAESFAKMKQFYGNIVLNNWYSIGTLAEKLQVLRVQNECYTAEVEQREEKRIEKIYLLKQCENDIIKYKQDLSDYKKNKLLLANLKADIQKYRKAIHDLRLEYFTLDLMYDKTEEEKKVLDKRLFKAVMEVQWKESIKSGLLHQRMGILSQATQVQGYVIKELLENEELSKSEESSVREQISKIENLPKSEDAYPISSLSRKMTFREVIRKKDNIISSLKYEIARVTNSHYDLLLRYEDKLREYGIHQAQMGFTPLRILPKHISIKKSVSVVGIRNA